MDDRSDQLGSLHCCYALYVASQSLNYHYFCYYINTISIKTLKTLAASLDER